MTKAKKGRAPHSVPASAGEKKRAHWVSKEAVALIKITLPQKIPDHRHLTRSLAMQTINWQKELVSLLQQTIDGRHFTERMIKERERMGFGGRKEDFPSPSCDGVISCWIYPTQKEIPIFGILSLKIIGLCYDWPVPIHGYFKTYYYSCSFQSHSFKPSIKQAVFSVGYLLLTSMIYPTQWRIINFKKQKII